MKQKIFASALSLALATAGLIGAAPAFAGTVTGSLPVSATVANSCVISSVNAIAFGAYDPANANASAPLKATGAVNVTCTKGGSVSVALDQGANPTASSTCVAPARQMKDSGTDVLAYSIYSDSADTKAWGCDATNEVSFTSASVSTPTALSTYGSIPAAQDVPAGSYNDTVTVTVSF